MLLRPLLLAYYSLPCQHASVPACTHSFTQSFIQQGLLSTCLVTTELVTGDTKRQQPRPCSQGGRSGNLQPCSVTSACRGKPQELWWPHQARASEEENFELRLEGWIGIARVVEQIEQQVKVDRCEETQQVQRTEGVWVGRSEKGIEKRKKGRRDQML